MLKAMKQGVSDRWPKVSFFSFSGGSRRIPYGNECYEKLVAIHSMEASRRLTRLY